MSLPSLPTFVGIGAQKSATTWCWRVLDEHPQVQMAQPKELEFFSENHRRGLDWYASHFRGEPPVRGEISPLYMDDPRAAERIADGCPDAQILVVLRDPRERALSNLLHDLRDAQGGVSDATDERMKEFAAGNDSYLRRSRYAESLAPYYERFPREQIVVLFYEEMRRDPHFFVRELYSRLGADPEHLPESLTKAENKTVDYWSPALFQQVRRCSQAANSWGPTRSGMEWLYRHTRLRERALRWLEIDRGRPEVDFERVFGEEASERLLEDSQSLTREYGLSLPEEWNPPVPSLARRAG